MNYNSISFIGLGLIGGSVAKAVKKYHPNIKLFAHASDKTLHAAFSEGIIENNSPLSMEALAGSDLIILCCPVGTNISYLDKLIPHLTNKQTLTDVGSVKGDLHHAIRSRHVTEFFVGGHPMAGSEKSGYSYSYPELINGCKYVLTTDDGKENEKSKKLSEFVKTLGCNPLLMSFTEHDKCAAAISHLPHVLASVLANFVGKSDDTGFMKILAASGYRDTTRIAQGSPEMWEQICMANYESLLDMIGGFERRLQSIRLMIESNDSSALYEFFEEAKKYRENIDE